MSINVNLTPQLEEMVRQKVRSGMYSSSSEVVREALRLMQEKERCQSIKIDQLRQDIREGIQSGEPSGWNAEELKLKSREKKSGKHCE
ncbi:MAG: type II toxin-antitoxin system ParD family antitoxin [Chlorobiaceae bacterium]|jgi:antitoxin ParD1/3/4|nr:type II toxin-antitoxin system ParD family antitoxin [Chlorobiaceae bacterium]